MKRKVTEMDLLAILKDEISKGTPIAYQVEKNEVKILGSLDNIDFVFDLLYEMEFQGLAERIGHEIVEHPSYIKGEPIWEWLWERTGGVYTRIQMQIPLGITHGNEA
ncbi:hypothetical protein [Porphyromonas catoniae]|nr:hypothetical protein [Porphyromonas catoniae]